MMEVKMRTVFNVTLDLDAGETRPVLIKHPRPLKFLGIVGNDHGQEIKVLGIHVDHQPTGSTVLCSAFNQRLSTFFLGMREVAVRKLEREETLRVVLQNTSKETRLIDLDLVFEPVIE